MPQPHRRHPESDRCNRGLDMEHIIDVHGLTHSYGAHKALQGLSFNVSAGEGSLLQIVTGNKVYRSLSIDHEEIDGVILNLLAFVELLP